MRHADPVREGSALEQVRRWAHRNWSHAAKDGPAGLIIDVSGMALLQNSACRGIHAAGLVE
ncbi:hypothetical protein [Paracoccus yeei]|uniref:hypothetical protein n=1 Tax=Paracoccus yeei TaxID=147645 RepID=UPI00117C7C08|nr:hypothetical protein [Paracoccus yeei]